MDLQEVGCGYVDWIGLAQVVIIAFLKIKYYYSAR